MLWLLILLTTCVTQLLAVSTRGHYTRRTHLHTRQDIAHPLATWLWDTEMIADSPSVQQFISFSQANSVQRVFAQINPDIEDTVWQSFISQCNTNGITVDALMGSSQWVIGSGKPSLQSSLDWIKQFQDSAPSGARFKGIHMDVEPWGLPDWETEKDSYITGWENVVESVVSFAKSLEMSVAADLPFWANTLSSTIEGQTSDIWMLNRLDFAVFMTYRNTANALQALANPILEAGDATGTPVWMAVETTFEDAQLSYWGQTAAKLRSDLAQIASASGTHESFGGISVHDYKGWLAME